MAGILFSQMEPPAALEAEFHDWYNTEHVPVRLALDGFDRARRFEAIAGAPRFLAVYELSDLNVFSTPNFRVLKTHPSKRTQRMLAEVNGFTRYVCEQIADTGAAKEGQFLSVNAFNVPSVAVSEFDDWYESEHIARLMAAADWLRVRRYRVIDADDNAWTHFALHELGSSEVMSSPERTFARTGPKRDVLAQHPWFGKSGRWLYRVIFDSAQNGA